MVANSLVSFKTPFIKSWVLSSDSIDEIQISKNTKSFNDSLHYELLQLLKEYSNSKLFYIDVYKLLESIYQNPERYGFTKENADEPVIKWKERFTLFGSNSDFSELYLAAKSRIWWDDSHISSAVQRLIADEAIKATHM